jgi:CheY-like chemotaxis protein
MREDLIPCTRMSTHGTLWIADDNADVRLFLQKAFVEMGWSIPISSFENGGELISTLERTKQIPSLLLLDLKMPVLGGLEVLEILKNDPRFQSIAIIVFSSSRKTSDVQNAYSSGAKLYLLKPALLEDYRMIALFLMQRGDELCKLRSQTAAARALTVFDVVGLLSKDRAEIEKRIRL